MPTFINGNETMNSTHAQFVSLHITNTPAALSKHNTSAVVPSMGDTPKLLSERQEEEIAIIRQFGYGGARERRERRWCPPCKEEESYQYF